VGATWQRRGGWLVPLPRGPWYLLLCQKRVFSLVSGAQLSHVAPLQTRARVQYLEGTYSLSPASAIRVHAAYMAIEILKCLPLCVASRSA